MIVVCRWCHAANGVTHIRDFVRAGNPQRKLSVYQCKTCGVRFIMNPDDNKFNAKINKWADK